MMRGTVNNQRSSIQNLEAPCGSFQNLPGPLDTSVPVFARRFAPNPGASHSTSGTARSKNIWKQFSAQLEIDLLLLGLSVLTLGALHLSLSREVASDIFKAGEVAVLETVAPSHSMLISREASYLLINALNERRLANSTDNQQVAALCCSIQTSIIEPNQPHRNNSEKKAPIADWVSISAKQILLGGTSILKSKPSPSDLKSHINSTSTADEKNKNWPKTDIGETFPSAVDAAPPPTRKKLATKKTVTTVLRPAPTTIYAAEKNTHIDDPNTATIKKLAKSNFPETTALTRFSLGAASIAEKNTQIVLQSIPQIPLGDVSDDTNTITLRNFTAAL